MTLEFYRDYCLAKAGVTEDTPFNPDTLCFRVGGKIFSICTISNFDFVNLKCDPERAAELRERYPGITPGYHMKSSMTKKSHTGMIIFCEIPYGL